MNDTITKLDSLSAAVAEQHDTMTAAIADERAAEETLLTRVVTAVKPALRALSSRLLAETRTWWPSNVETAAEKSYHPERGVLVRGDGPVRDHATANEGSIEGEDLVLLEDGTFARRAWSGSWTRWQGHASRSTSTLEPLTLAEVVAEHDVDEIAARLVALLEQSRDGRAPKTTAAARARAEKLRAVTALLGGAK